MVTDAERIKAGSPIPALWRLTGDGTVKCDRCLTGVATTAVWVASKASGRLVLTLRCSGCGAGSGRQRVHARRRNALTNR